MHPDFMKYEMNEASHEAGYDSYQTARIMILLSAKLKAGEHLSASSPRRSHSSKLLSSQRTMPSFEEPFWEKYGNRLRIFGTVEKILALNYPPAPGIALVPTRSLRQR
jgi:hypothetical protein